MYRKALHFSDDVTAKAIRAEPDPMRAKGLGRQVRGFDAKETL